MALVFLTRFASHGVLIYSFLIGGHVVVSAASAGLFNCLGVGCLQHFGSQRVQVWFPQLLTTVIKYNTAYKISREAVDSIETLNTLCRFILPILPLMMMFAGYAIAVLEQKWAWEGDSAADVSSGFYRLFFCSEIGNVHARLFLTF